MKKFGFAINSGCVKFKEVAHEKKVKLSNEGIIINNTINSDLLSIFETNLAQSGELEEIND